MSENIRLIKCPNCGANYPENERECPFCGAENKVLTDAEFQSKVEQKSKAIEEELVKPRKFINATGIYILIFIVFITIAVFIAFYKYMSVKDKPAVYDVSEEYIEELQKAVENKNYEKVERLVFDKNLYGGRYEGYCRLADVYGEFETMIKYEDEALKDASPDQVFISEENRVYAVSIDARVSMEYGLRVLWKANDYLDKNSSYGTEESIAEIRNDVYSKFNHWGIDNETVQTMLIDYIENGSSTEDDNSLISKCGETAADIILSEVK